jgi:hypothetical protein
VAGRGGGEGAARSLVAFSLPSSSPFSTLYVHSPGSGPGHSPSSCPFTHLDCGLSLRLMCWKLGPQCAYARGGTLRSGAYLKDGSLWDQTVSWDLVSSAQ